MRRKLWLKEVLKKHLDRHGGSHNKLSAEIKAANGEVRTVDRRKLRQLIEDESYSLTSGDLLALDNFLAPHGEGLAEHPLLVREGLLQTMAQQEEVRFVLGAKPHGRRHDVGPWDLRSLALMLRTLQTIRPNVAIEISDVVRPPESTREAEAEYEKLLGMRGVTVVAFGSPKASQMSELMLSEVLQCRDEAFQPPGNVLNDPVPFYFIRPADSYGEDYKMASRFSMEPHDLPRKHARRFENGQTWAIRYDLDKFGYATFPPTHAARDATADGRAAANNGNGADGDAKHHDYGVIIAQRKKELDQVWVLLLGLSGPGTLAATRLLVDPPEGVSFVLPDGDNEYLYAIAETDVTFTDAPGDARRPEGSRMVYGPKVVEVS